MKKLLFVSSSGGHFEQLKMLEPLMKKYPSCIVTEKVLEEGQANYYMLQVSHKDKWILFKLIVNLFRSIKVWLIEKPNVVISTGSMIVLPFALLAKITGQKIIFIETFAKINGGTLTGRVMYRLADLFIIQWEALRKTYPKAIYGGCIY